MRMRRSQVKQYYLKHRILQKDKEGGTIETFSEAIPIEAEIWQAGGAVKAMQYGNQLEYIKNMLYSGTEIVENDGICVNIPETEKPDYRVKSINADHDPCYITLEKIND